MSSRGRRALILALAYFAAGGAALAFAISPGYAAIAWPSAGIAVAALWLWGAELWPGVLLGSLAANAAGAWLRGATGAAPTFLAAWIGAGAAAQALTAATLARRATGGREPLSEEKLLFRFMMAAGPLAGLVASVWGTAGLLLFGRITASQSLYTWATWWVGDAIGVVFAAPLILLWSGRGLAGSRRGKATVTATMSATLILVLAIHDYTLRSEQVRAHARAERRLDDAALTLRVQIDSSFNAVRGAAALFESFPRVDRNEFSAYARAVLRTHPELLSLAWRPPSSEAALYREPADASHRSGEALLRAEARPFGSFGPSGTVEGEFDVDQAARGLSGSDTSVEFLVSPATNKDGADTAGSARSVEAAGRRWLLAARPGPGPQYSGDDLQRWLVLGRVLILMYLASWIALTLYGRAERISALVEFKTTELREQERRVMRAQRMESVGRLAGGVAHEFNNILMAASGLAQIVLTSLGAQHPSSADVDGIITSLRRAGNLVSQLLTYSRRREALRRPTDLDALVAGMSKMLGAALGRRVALELRTGGGPAWVMADAGQAEQVLLNLCFNARDAVSGKGAVRVSLREEALERGRGDALLPVPPGRYWVLEVADDGPGVPVPERARLLEPFFTTKPFGEGTGLWLAVVSGIVRQHGGGLDISTAPEKGALVSVYWPACPSPAAPAAVADAAPPRGAEKVLIVDDEPMVRSTLERLLRGFGYATLCASGGEEGVRVLDAEPEVRAVVLDLVMPGMDGLETYDRMKARRPELKVLFLSGFAPLELTQEIRRRGAPFLGKPAEPLALARALRRTLDGGPA